MEHATRFLKGTDTEIHKKVLDLSPRYYNRTPRHDGKVQQHHIALERKKNGDIEHVMSVFRPDADCKKANTARHKRAPRNEAHQDCHRDRYI